MQYLHARVCCGAIRNLLKAGRPFIALVLLLITLLAAGAVGKFMQPVKAATFTVCAIGCNFTTIQAAVNAADATAELDTINVQAGTYNERVTIPSTEPGLTINGANVNINACTGARVAESFVGTALGAFRIQANNVTINGFTIQGVDGTVVGSTGAGVHMADDISGTQVLNNIIQNNTFGIQLNGASVLVQDNNIRNNNNPGPATGNGIYSDQGLTNANITANCFSGHTNTASNIIGSPCFGGAQTVNNVQLTNNTATNDAAFQFLGGSNYTITGNRSTGSTNDAIVFDGGVDTALVSGNNLSGGAGSGIQISSLDCAGNPPNANITINCNRIVNFGLDAITVLTLAYTGTLNAENNFFGCNAGPGTMGCETVAAPDGNVDFTPWLVLTLTLSPNPPVPGGMATLTASLNTNSASMATGCNLSGIPVTFASNCGSVNPGATTTTNGTATSTLTTPTATSSCIASATVDGQTQQIITCVNTPPTITAINQTRKQGDPPTNVQIATVMDADQTENTLAVTVNGGPSATVNDVTVSNITVDAAGQVSANILVTCAALSANFTLTVTDGCNVTANAMLTVSIMPNMPPTVGTYPDTTVVTGGTLTITPDVAPTDNNTVASVTATASPASFTGSFPPGNTSSGAITVVNAGPPGVYTVTVTLTDNCMAPTIRMFTLTVSPCGATLSKQRELFAANGGPDSFTVTIAPGCMWTAVSDNPDWIVVNSPVGTATGPGTVNYTVLSHTNPTRRLGSITVAGQTFRVFQGAHYTDVPLAHPFYTEIGKISALGITIGCATGLYCPDSNTTREQMAIFIERAIGVFNPPEPLMQTFADVPPTRVGYPFVEDLVARGITQGCAAGPPRLYCPDDAVTREQMAIFILRGLGVFVPPPGPVTPTFADVPNSGATDASYEFIEELFARGITLGCQLGPPRLYCPFDPVTRGQMAVFLLRAFGM